MGGAHFLLPRPQWVQSQLCRCCRSDVCTQEARTVAHPNTPPKPRSLAGWGRSRDAHPPGIDQSRGSGCFYPPPAKRSLPAAPPTALPAALQRTSRGFQAHPFHPGLWLEPGTPPRSRGQPPPNRRRDAACHWPPEMGKLIGHRCDPSHVTIGPFVAIAALLLVLSLTFFFTLNRDWLDRHLDAPQHQRLAAGGNGRRCGRAGKYAGSRVRPSNDAATSISSSGRWPK